MVMQYPFQMSLSATYHWLVQFTEVWCANEMQKFEH